MKSNVDCLRLGGFPAYAMQVGSRFISKTVAVLMCAMAASMSLPAHDPHDPITVVSVSPDFDQDQTVFAATGFLSLKIGLQIVLKSVDGGITWSVIPNLPSNGTVTAVAFSPGYREDKTVFVAGGGGLFRSTNQGQSWTTLSKQSVQSLALSPNFVNDNLILLLTSQRAIYESTDRGTSWATLPAPAPLTGGLNVIAVSPNYSADNILLAGAASDGIFRSTDGGNTWLRTTGNMRGLTALGFSPCFASDQKVLASTTGAGVLISSDGGISWIPANTGLSDTNVSALTLSDGFCTDSTVWAASATGGAFLSQSGGSGWTARTKVPRQLSDQTQTHYQTEFDPLIWPTSIV